MTSPQMHWLPKTRIARFPSQSSLGHAKATTEELSSKLTKTKCFLTFRLSSPIHLFLKLIESLRTRRLTQTMRLRFAEDLSLKTLALIWVATQNFANQQTRFSSAPTRQRMKTKSLAMVLTPPIACFTRSPLSTALKAETTS